MVPANGVKRFETGAVRSTDADDVRYDLISTIGLRRLAARYALGAKNYGVDNWRKGIPFSDLYNHLMRHIELARAGDRSDDNLAAAAWGLFTLMDLQETKPEMDDRYSAGNEATGDPVVAFMEFITARESCAVLPDGRIVVLQIRDGGGCEDCKPAVDAPDSQLPFAHCDCPDCNRARERKAADVVPEVEPAVHPSAGSFFGNGSQPSPPMCGCPECNRARERVAADVVPEVKPTGDAPVPPSVLLDLESLAVERAAGDDKVAAVARAAAVLAPLLAADRLRRDEVDYKLWSGVMIGSPYTTNESDRIVREAIDKGLADLYAPAAVADHPGDDPDDLAEIDLDDVDFGDFESELTETLHDLGVEILAINKANGWNVTTPETWAGSGPYKIPAVIALIHSEASEALEAFRNGDVENFKEEMADILIRVLDCTAGLGFEMAGPIMAKLAANRTRGYRHGGKRV